MKYEKHRMDWEDLAQEDPMWAVLSDPAKKHAWKEADFFLSGEQEIQQALERAARFNLPALFERALDFGCGMGRLTRALSRRFSDCWGIDISEAMIRKAGALTPQVRFVVNDHPDLALFPDNHFDFVYSVLVLQHLPAPKDIAAFIREFLRVLRPGGVCIFQVPTYLAPIHRIQPRRRLYRALRVMGISSSVLLRMHLDPMRATFLSQKKIACIISVSSCSLVACECDSCMPGGESCTYYVTKGEYIVQPPEPASPKSEVHY